MPLLKTIRQATPCGGPVQALTRRAEPVRPGLSFSAASAALAVSLGSTPWLQHNGLLAATTSHVITTGCR